MTRKYKGNKSNIEIQQKNKLLIFDAINKAGVKGITRKEIMSSAHISKKTLWNHLKNYNSNLSKIKGSDGVARYYLKEHYEKLNSLPTPQLWGKITTDMLSWAKKIGLVPADISYGDFYSKHGVYFYPIKTDIGFEVRFIFQDASKLDHTKLTHDFYCE